MGFTISGYTSVGKTTHARLLARALGYRHIWAAGMLLRELGFPDVENTESTLWFRHMDEISRLREAGDADAVVDAALTAYATQDDVIIDARFVPWAGATGMVTIWLESDLLARSRKCALSMAHSEPVPTLPECARLIHRKDTEDVDRVARFYGGVFSPDPDLFDVVLDVSPFARQRSFDDADAAITACHEYVLAAVESTMGRPEAAHRLMDRSPELAAVVFRTVPGISRERSESPYRS